MGMIGKVVEIKRRDETEGQVLITNVLCKAVCKVLLPTDGRKVVQGIEGLTLNLKPYED